MLLPSMTSVLFACSFEIVDLRILYTPATPRTRIHKPKQMRYNFVYVFIILLRYSVPASLAQAYPFSPISLNKEISVTGTSEAGLILEP